MCINIAVASIVSTPLLKLREYWLMLAGYMYSTTRSMTFENAGTNEVGRCVFFLGDRIILAFFHVVGSLPSVNDWLMSLGKNCLVASGAFLIIE